MTGDDDRGCKSQAGFDGSEAVQEMSPASRDVLAERQRQIEAEGWTVEHDDEHDDGSMADAAACYAATFRAFKIEVVCGRAYETYERPVDLWPWDDKWWKPKDRRSDLVRAGALIIAEIERLDRAAPQPSEDRHD